ncbi:PH domain-containing protein [Natronorubrum bangense]|nr:PH domain-containing protein [Natronorubrum bangense]
MSKQATRGQSMDDREGSSDEPASQPQERRQPAPSEETASIPLLEGEEILIDERPAWSAWSYHLIVAGLVLLGSIAFEELLVGVIGAGLIAAYVWYQRSKVTYVVTDRRIVVVTGHSSKSTNETWMEDVRGLQTGASAVERLLGHGHITVSHAVLPTGFGRFKGLRLGGVPNYEEIAAVIRTRQSDRKDGRY